RLTVAADAATVDPRLVELHRGVVDQVADLEIVGAVEDQISILHQLDDVGAIDVGDDRLDSDLGVDLPQLASRGLRLGQVRRHVGFIKQYLALEVMRLDEIAVDDAQVTDTGPYQGVGQHGAQSAAATECDAAIAEPDLALGADAGK